MYSPSQPRGRDGKFAPAAHKAERRHRDTSRYPVMKAAGQGRSVGSHPGYTVSSLNERTGNFEIVSTGKRKSVSENIARMQRFDRKYTKIF